MKISFSASAMNAPFRSYMAATALATLPSVLNHVYLGHVRTISVYMGRISAHVTCLYVHEKVCLSFPSVLNHVYRGHVRTVYIHMSRIASLHTCVASLYSWSRVITCATSQSLEPCVSSIHTYCLCVYGLYFCIRLSCLYVHENVCHFLESWTMCT